MNPLPIITYPDTFLRQKSVPVEEIERLEKELFDQMVYTMKHSSGIGLAAPQVGVGRQILVVDIGEGPIKLANPKVIETFGVSGMVEGCLSVPGRGINILRPEKIVVEGTDEDGVIRHIKAQGLLARVLQHEIDHLNGKLIIDYALPGIPDAPGGEGYAHI